MMHLKRIQSSVQHIVRLMDDVLILGKSDADRLVPEPVPVNVNQLVASLIDEHTMGHKATQHIAFTNDMECDSALLDPKLFRQIFGNIFFQCLEIFPARQYYNRISGRRLCVVTALGKRRRHRNSARRTRPPAIWITLFTGPETGPETVPGDADWGMSIR